MKYRLEGTGTEWTIEPATNERWVLKRRSEAEWLDVGTYKTPNEAAAIAGARMAKAVNRIERHVNRLRFVLSSWDVVEQG